MFPNRCFPDKAIDLLDEVGAYTLLNNKKIKIDNSENLKSTACGLDGFDGDSTNIYTNKNEKIIF